VKKPYGKDRRGLHFLVLTFLQTGRGKNKERKTLDERDREKKIDKQRDK